MKTVVSRLHQVNIEAETTNATTLFWANAIRREDPAPRDPLILSGIIGVAQRWQGPSMATNAATNSSLRHTQPHRHDRTSTTKVNDHRHDRTSMTKVNDHRHDHRYDRTATTDVNDIRLHTNGQRHLTALQ